MEFETLPYFMAHPGIYKPVGNRRYSPYLTFPAENALMRDLDYLSQLCPVKVRRYQAKIKEIVDKLDYEGSMIYDEFPDRFLVERMASNITELITKEDKADYKDEKNAGQEKTDDKSLIFVLLAIEIYKRRNCKKSKYFI